MEFTGWLQRSSYDTEDLGAVSADEAIAAFRRLDHAAERATAAERARAGADWCPHGIGLNGPDGRLIHVFSGDEGRFDVLLEKNKEGLLGFAGMTDKRTLQGVDVDGVVELLGRALDDFDATFNS